MPPDVFETFPPSITVIPQLLTTKSIVAKIATKNNEPFTVKQSKSNEKITLDFDHDAETPLIPLKNPKQTIEPELSRIETTTTTTTTQVS